MADDDKGQISLAARFGAKIKALTLRATTAEQKVTELTGQVTTLTTERDQLKQQVLTPDAKDKKISELTATIRGGKHKARFAALAKEAGASEAAIDDLYDLSGHKAETDEPDDESLKALVDAAKTKRPYAFGSAVGTDPNPTRGADPAPAAKPIPGQGRGGANNGADGTIITAQQRADPGFMLNPANREVIAAAAREGRFR